MSNMEVKSKDIRVKLLSKYYEDVETRLKNFEVRFNDRDYQVGDWLILCEWDGFKFTGYEIVRKIIYVCSLDEIGLTGWVAMGLK